MCPFCKRELTGKTYHVSKSNRASKRICRRCYQKHHREKLSIEKLKEVRFKDTERQRKSRANNPERTEANKKKSYQSKEGHVFWVFNGIRRYFKPWRQNHSSRQEFKEWSLSDPAYHSLWQEWVNDGCSIDATPVVMRNVRKNGFLIDNLRWVRKAEFSWWNEDRRILAEVEKELNEQQKIRNKSTKEWKKKVREDWQRFKQEKLSANQVARNVFMPPQPGNSCISIDISNKGAKS